MVSLKVAESNNKIILLHQKRQLFCSINILFRVEAMCILYVHYEFIIVFMYMYSKQPGLCFFFLWTIHCVHVCIFIFFYICGVTFIYLAELLNIQKKMLELQSQLKRRKINKKKISSESSSSLVANGTKENREDDISFRLQQKDQSSCERQKQPPLISKQKTDRHKQKTDRHNQKTDRHNQKISDQQTTATSLPSKKGIKKSFSRKNGEQFKSEKKTCKIVSPNSEVKVPKDKKGNI